MESEPSAGPEAPEKTVLVSFRWPESLVKALLDECHRRKMSGVRPRTQREVTAEALREYLERQTKT